MGLFDFLGGKINFNEPFSKRALKQQTGQDRSHFSDLLNNIIQRGQNLQDQPSLTAKDLFGPQMQKLYDSARATANGTKQALSRAMLANGGDVSGSGAASLFDLGAQTNSNISDIGLRFSRLADQVNRFRKQRGDQLTAQGLSGLQNIFTNDQNTLNQVIQREIQRKTARKQRGAGVFGGILNTIGSIGGALIGACWVAEELYGKDHEKVVVIRKFLLENEGEKNMFGQFLDEYKKDGRDWAAKVKHDLPARMAAEKLFNELYQVAKAA